MPTFFNLLFLKHAWDFLVLKFTNETFVHNKPSLNKYDKPVPRIDK